MHPQPFTPIHASGLRELYLSVAVHLEKRPEDYSFHALRVPDLDAGEKGCVWGLLGLYAGLPGGTYVEEVATTLGFGSSACLYRYLNAADLRLYTWPRILWDLVRGREPTSWHNDPKAAARALRRLAAEMEP